MRKLSSLASPKMTFAVDGDTITVTTTIGPKTITVSFKLGEEFEFSPPPDEKPATVSIQFFRRMSILSWETTAILFSSLFFARA